MDLKLLLVKMLFLMRTICLVEMRLFAGTNSQEIQNLKHSFQLEVESNEDKIDDHVVEHEPQHTLEPQ